LAISFPAVITAHWIAETVTVNSGQAPQLLFDYGGFPAESYQYKYPARGSPELAGRVSALLAAAGIASKEDPARKWDHGVFVPLMLMYPEADIPVVSLSLQASLDPQAHIDIGRALAPLRGEGVLILGSGMSFHNFEYFFAHDPRKKQIGLAHSRVWNDFLVDTLVTGGLSRQEQLDRLAAWADAPSARDAHPPGREEHLLPLHVLLGAGEGASSCSLVGDPSEESEFADANFEWK
jgi:aromatic ring-opening dioxygenase catalytic subunit (LigB family)